MSHSDVGNILKKLGYDVLETLGNGARSTIFMVEDVHNGEKFALKRVIRNSSADQRFIDQAILEHDVSQKFNHPSLRKSIRIHRERSLFRLRELFIFMEPVVGQTLEQRRIKNMLEVCRVFQDTAIALGVMHRAGYVHADIKPNNILVTAKDMVKVIDFGQSCPIGTRKERIQGTPDYIAPEQVKRGHLTPATDVFNLGATMYFVLTGQHVPTLIPKTKSSTQISTGPNDAKPPVEINPNVPLALSSLVMSCIALSPRERPESMTRLYERLEMAIGQISQDTANAQLPANG